MKKRENGSSKNKITNKDENTVWRFGRLSHFFTPFFFCFYDADVIKIFAQAVIKKASGTDAQREYEISVLLRGLGRIHQ